MPVCRALPPPLKHCVFVGHCYVPSYYPVHFMMAAMLLLGMLALFIPTPPSERFGTESRGRLPLSEVPTIEPACLFIVCLFYCFTAHAKSA